MFDSYGEYRPNYRRQFLRFGAFNALIVGVGVLVIVMTISMIISASGLGFTVDADAFDRAMKRENIVSPVNEGYKYTGCGDGDLYHSGFSGFKNGEHVHGIVCAGVYKGTTIRYF